MPLQYRYDHALRAVMTTVTGVMTEEEVLTHLRKLRDDREIPDGYIEVVDFSSAEEFAVKLSGAGRISFLVPELRDRRNYQGTVFYAPTDHAFGMARMFKTMLEQLGSETEIYRDWDELKVAVKKWQDEEPA